MRIKLEIEGIKRLHAAMKTAPDAVKENMRLALKVSLRRIQCRAREDHIFQSRSGNLERSITAKVTREWPPRGEVFLDPAVTMTDSGVAYGVFQHNGTKDHWVDPIRRRALRWAGPGGFCFSGGHEVRGILKDPFVHLAGEHERDKINEVFNRYTEIALKEAGL